MIFNIFSLSIEVKLRKNQRKNRRILHTSTIEELREETLKRYMTDAQFYRF